MHGRFADITAQGVPQVFAQLFGEGSARFVGCGLVDLVKHNAGNISVSDCVDARVHAHDISFDGRIFVSDTQHSQVSAINQPVTIRNSPDMLNRGADTSACVSFRERGNVNAKNVGVVAIHNSGMTIDAQVALRNVKHSMFAGWEADNAPTNPGVGQHETRIRLEPARRSCRLDYRNRRVTCKFTATTSASLRNEFGRDLAATYARFWKPRPGRWRFDLKVATRRAVCE